ncbi:MAG: hypothetical protein E7502_03495 [Ruminococcus sp.]|nr:hypothetical protein [Ruminococcus sp.]
MLNFLNSVFGMIPDILFALILLVIAFVAAGIVKSLLIKLLDKIKADELLAKVGIKDDAAKNAKAFIVKLVYFVTFLLFLPGVLDKLGMHSVSTPISGLANSFLSFLPKLVAAGLILAIGIFVANIVKDLLLPVLKATKIDELQKKSGVEASEKASFSNILTNVVYGFILLIVITSALDQLGIAAISAPTNAIVSSVFAAIPNIFGAIVIIAIGVFISNLVSGLLENLLAGIGTDSLIEKITGTPAKKVQLSKIISAVVKYLLVVIFLVQGINVLRLPVLTDVGEIILGYVPTAISIVLILGFGIFAANTAENAIISKFPKAKATAIAAKAAIYVVLGFLCMSQLGIANAIVESTFILIIAALCIAFAISFGVGGRGFAANQLDKLEKKLESEESKKAE